MWAEAVTAGDVRLENLGWPLRERVRERLARMKTFESTGRAERPSRAEDLR
jgi:hypothetical protein